MNRVVAAALLLVVLGAAPARAEGPSPFGDPVTSDGTQAKYDAADGSNAPAPAKGQGNKQPQGKQPAQGSGKQPQSKPAAAQPKPAAAQPKPASSQPKPAASPSKPAGPQPKTANVPPKAAGGGRPGGRTRCLSQAETRETVTGRKLFSPFTALRTAGAHARGETIGVRLCRHNDDLFYEVNVLRRDGRVVKVILEAASGKILRSVNDR